MKKSGLMLALGLVTSLSTVVAWNEADSLISRSFLEHNYIPSVKEDIASATNDSMDQVYHEKIADIQSLQRDIAFYSEQMEESTGLAVMDLTVGQEIRLGMGRVVIPVDGIFYLAKEGTVINLSQGNTVEAGVLTLGEQYLVAEDSTATVLVQAESRVIIQGNYTLGQIAAGEFVDVTPEDWFSTSVSFVTGANLFTGTSANYFSPYMTMDRSMMMAVLFRLANSPMEELYESQASFLDVPEGEWYEPYVRWGAAQNVTAGMGDGYFEPKGTVTRQQVLVMLHAFVRDYLQLEVHQRTDLGNYQDVDAVAFWAEDSVSWAVACGLMEGIPSSDQWLLAEVVASRAEVATILANFTLKFL